MAGDYMKWSHGLERKPKMLAVAGVLKVHPLHAAGNCLKFWCWCDLQATNDMQRGDDLHMRLPGDAKALRAMLDGRDVADRKGFCAALESVGWIKVGDRKLIVPGFFKYTDDTAKTRALAAEKKRKQRKQAQKDAKSNGAASPDGPDMSRDNAGTQPGTGNDRAEAEQSRAAESRKSAEEFCSALPDGTPKALCSLLLAQMPAGIKPLDALAIAEEPRATRERVLWALDRLRDELRRADEKRREPIDNPAGWLRNLIAGEGEPSAKWRRTNMRRVLALGAAKDAAQARAAQDAGGAG